MPIVCQACNNRRATVHLTDIAPSGEAIERHLCDECASQEGLALKAHETTTEILQAFLKQKAGIKTAAAALCCPDCGMTLEEFQKRGVLGCPSDYQVFSDILNQIIDRAHEGATHHLGKVPRRAGDGARRVIELRRLRRDLHDAVQLEDYERASALRDQIKTLEQI